jgi:putative Mg2+ transporter-C (MgtC) family protein
MMDELTLSARLVAALLLSSLIGLNREMGGHAAGLRTHMLVGLGAALFTVLSFVGFGAGDPSRVAAQIVTGIGFLGAGTIVRRSDDSPQGLTTAASIWAVAAVGMAAGAGMFILAGVTTLLILITLIVVRLVEKHALPDPNNKNDEDEKPAKAKK